MSDEIRMSIKERFRSLKEQRKAALATADAILEEMKRLKVAYQALNGEDASFEAMVGDAMAPTPKEEDSAPERRKEHTLNGDEVRDALHEVLLFGPLTEEEIKEQVGAIAKEKGRSRKGLHWVIGRALRKGDDFEEATGDKWKVKSPRETALLPRVRTLLQELGPLTEPKLRAKIEEIHPKSEAILDKLLNRTLRSGPFEFNGAQWTLVPAKEQKK